MSWYLVVGVSAVLRPSRLRAVPPGFFSDFTRGSAFSPQKRIIQLQSLQFCYQLVRIFYDVAGMCVAEIGVGRRWVSF